MNRDALFDRFTNPSERALATAELASLGVGAIQILQRLFSGEARNSFGVPYRQLGMPMDCGLVAAGRLGPVAKPLEHYLREALTAGHVYAAEALGKLGFLDELSIEALADTLAVNDGISFESAHALVRSGHTKHPAVVKAVQGSPWAAARIEQAARHIANGRGSGAPSA